MAASQNPFILVKEFLRDTWLEIRLPMVYGGTLDDVEKQCNLANPADPEHVRLFWERFDVTFKQDTFTQMLLNEGYIQNCQDPWMVMAYSGDADSVAAWHEKARTIKVVIRHVSRAQLRLFRCHFDGAAPEGFDKAAVASAFHLFGIGHYTPADPPESDNRRMNDFRQWFRWAAFADTAATVADLGIGPEDVQAWKTLQGMILYGLLLHTHHDTREIQRKKLHPPGLLTADEDGIRTFALAPGTNARQHLIDLYRETAE